MLLLVGFPSVYGVLQHASPLPTTLQLSNTLSDGMVLQRSPAAAMVWGFAPPAVHVTTTFGTHTLNAITDITGVWRQELPPTNATKVEQTLLFNSSAGSTTLRVLYGEVFLCGE
jgi:sialate O-acetylesterase